jgi:hypothetical protein
VGAGRAKKVAKQFPITPLSTAAPTIVPALPAEDPARLQRSVAEEGGNLIVIHF